MNKQLQIRVRELVHIARARIERQYDTLTDDVKLFNENGDRALGTLFQKRLDVQKEIDQYLIDRAEK